MNIKIFTIFLLIFIPTSHCLAADVFEDPEELEEKPELKNNPLIQDFLNPDESPESRKIKPTWQKFKPVDASSVNYNYTNPNTPREEMLPQKPSEYKTDPFSNRIEYLEEKLGVNKPKYPTF